MAKNLRNFQTQYTEDTTLIRVQEEVSTTFKQLMDLPQINGELIENINLKGGESLESSLNYYSRGESVLCRVRGYTSGDQIFATESEYDLLPLFTGSSPDDENMHVKSNGVDNQVIQVPYSGWYEISWRIFLKNGSALEHYTNRLAILRVYVALGIDSVPGIPIFIDFIKEKGGGPFNHDGDAFFESRIIWDANAGYTFSATIENGSATDTFQLDNYPTAILTKGSEEIMDGKSGNFQVRMIRSNSSQANIPLTDPVKNTVGHSLGKPVSGVQVVKSNQPVNVWIKSTNKNSIILCCDNNATVNLWVW